MEANKKFVQKINARIKRFRNWMSKNNVDPTWFEMRVIDDIAKYNGVVLTKTKDNKPRNISTKSEFDENTIKMIESAIGTKEEMITRSTNFFMGAYEEEENVPDVKNMTIQDIFKNAGIVAQIYAAYDEALEDYYYYHAKDSVFDFSPYDNEIKDVLAALLMEIEDKIHHPGVWALPVERIQENKELIGNFTALMEAIKSQNQSEMNKVAKGILSSMQAR